MGQHAEAVAAAEEAAKSPTARLVDLYDAACACSLAAGATKDKTQQEEYATRAIVLLGRVRVGQFFNPKRFGEFQKDDDFALHHARTSVSSLNRWVPGKAPQGFGGPKPAAGQGIRPGGEVPPRMPGCSRESPAG